MKDSRTVTVKYACNLENGDPKKDNNYFAIQIGQLLLEISRKGVCVVTVNHSRYKNKLLKFQLKITIVDISISKSTREIIAPSDKILYTPLVISSVLSFRHRT